MKKTPKANGMKCEDFEIDENVYCAGDRECCAVCKWNNGAVGACVIGRGEVEPA